MTLLDRTFNFAHHSIMMTCKDYDPLKHNVMEITQILTRAFSVDLLTQDVGRKKALLIYVHRTFYCQSGLAYIHSSVHMLLVYSVFDSFG